MLATINHPPTRPSTHTPYSPPFSTVALLPPHLQAQAGSPGDTHPEDDPDSDKPTPRKT